MSTFIGILYVIIAVVQVGWYVSIYISAKRTKNNTAGCNTELQDLNRTISGLRRDLNRFEKSNYDAIIRLGDRIEESLDSIEIEITDELEWDDGEDDRLADEALAQLDRELEDGAGDAN